MCVYAANTSNYSIQTTITQAFLMSCMPAICSDVRSYPHNVNEFPDIFKETMEYNLSTPKMTWAQGNTDDIEDSGKNKVLLTAGEHACLHHVMTDCSLARSNVIKTNDCQTVQTDVTLFYVKQEMTQANRGTQAIVTGSDGGND